MTREDIEKLIAADEGETVEVKETTGQRVDACETLCAFLNKKGGTVIFGVTRKGKLAGQLMSDSTKRDLFDAFQKFEPAAVIEVEYVPVDESHTAIVCRVDKGNCAPYVYDGRPYKRVQSSTTMMPQEEYERMLKARGGFASDWEQKANPSLTLDDIDAEEVRRTARKAVQVGRLDDAIDTEDVPNLLDHFKVRREGQLLNAAAALFGKVHIGNYPQCQLKMGWFKGRDTSAFGDVDKQFGHIGKLLNDAMRFCFRHLNLSAVITGKIDRDEELEVPAAALREAIINALTHRSYEERGATVYLAIFEDRVEIRNPGSFPPELDPSTLFTPPKEHSIPRNPVIADVLYLRKSIETWGRGLGVMASECQRVGLPLPTTRIEGGYVVTTFLRPPDGIAPMLSGALSGTACQITGTSGSLSGSDLDQGDPDLAVRLLETVRLNPLISRRLLAIELKVSERKVRDTIAKLKEAGYILRQGADHGGIWRISRKTGTDGPQVGVETSKVGVESPKVGVENGKVGAEVGVEKPKVGVEIAKVGAEIDFDQVLSANRKAFRETCRTVWSYLADHPQTSQPEMAAALKIAVSTAQCACNALKEVGLLVREGATKNGRWIVCTGKKNVGDAAPADAKSAKVAKGRKGGRARRPATADGRARTPVAPR